MASHPESASLRFAPALPDQIPEILEMVRDYHSYDHLEFDAGLIRGLLEQVIGDDRLGRLWLLRLGEATVGYLLLSFGFSLEFKGRDAFIDELFLKEGFRGRGLGRQALELVRDAALGLGLRALHLEVERKNVNALKLYESAGFEDHDRFMMTRWLTT